MFVPNYNLTCMKDSHALGNTKPPLLLALERIILKMLFNIARGDVRIKSAVRDLVVGLPWAEIDRLGENNIVNTWFKPCMSKKSLPKSQIPENVFRY